MIYRCSLCGATHDTALMTVTSETGTYVDPMANSSKFWTLHKIHGACQSYATQWGRWDRGAVMDLSGGTLKGVRGTHAAGENALGKKHAKGYDPSSCHYPQLDGRANGIIAFVNLAGLSAGEVDADAGPLTDVKRRVLEFVEQMGTKDRLTMPDYAARELLSAELETYSEDISGMVKHLENMRAGGAA